MMTAVTDTPISLFNESRKRGLLLLCVFVFPLIFTSILFLLVAILSDIDFKVIGHKTEFAEILSPKNKTNVSKKFEISGTLETPLLDHTYYLIEYRNKRYWPKFDLGNKATQWKKQLTHRAAKDKFSAYQVIMADASLKAEIDSWFITARDTGKYPGIATLEITHLVANLRVKSQ